MRRLNIRLLPALVTLALAPSSTAFAQAWVNARGELSLSLRSDFQMSQGVWHGSQLITGVPVDASNDGVSAEYVPLEHLALGLSLNGNGVRYRGPMSMPGAAFPYNHGSQ